MVKWPTSQLPIIQEVSPRAACVFVRLYLVSRGGATIRDIGPDSLSFVDRTYVLGTSFSSTGFLMSRYSR
jgi:hypothetical protein